MASQSHTNRGSNGTNGEGTDSPNAEAQHPRSPATNGAANVDAWTFIDVFMRRWFWLALAGVLLGGAGAFAGMYLWTASYSATTQLMRAESEHLTEFFKPRAFTEHTFGSLLRTPELLARVGSQLSPPLSGNEVGGMVQITPVPESDIVSITVHGDDPAFVVYLANLYATNTVGFTRELQKREAGQVNEALKVQLSQLDTDVANLQEQLRNAPVASFQPNQQLTALYERLKVAETELAVARSRYHDVHPDVQRHLAEVEELQKQVQKFADQANTSGARRELLPPQAATQSSTNSSRTNPLPRVSTDAFDPGHEFLRNQLYAIQAARMTLAARQRDAETFVNNPPGYATVLTPATAQEVGINDPKPKIVFLGLLGFAVGVASALALALLVELLDDRLRTVDDVRRVTRLPVLATLGDLRRITPAAQSNWAFRTWTALQSRLSLSSNHGLVCGITSSAPGEGRTTWLQLLAHAASQCGFKVLTIATLPSPDDQNGNGNGHAWHPPSEEGSKHHAQDQPASAGFEAEQGSKSGEYETVPAHADHADGDAPVTRTMALTGSVLSSPAQVTQRLTGTQAQPLVHIPLPGWVWSLDRRKQWNSALAQWSLIDNVVILVELPPASSSEAVLLAENLPNLIWLADSGRSSAADCREQLQTLRNARCNLVGSVLNHEPGPPLKNRFSRWVGCWMFAALAAFAISTADAQVPTQTPLSTQTPLPTQAPLQAGATAAVSVQPATQVAAEPAEPPRTNVSFSVTAQNRAPWQQRLTVGAGDILNFGLFGQPDLTRTEVVVGPDGRVSYLQATDVPANGLTIDELRARFDEALSKYYRSPRTMITPVTWRSKKYYMLGKVVNKGVYTLDRPITVIEAVARAQGLETGLLDQNSVDLADLQRSFLMRRGQKTPVNFEKLFYEGDLSQNVAVEPDDYLYFAAGNLREVYVVGEVNQPGPVLYTANTTVVGAIAARNGFTDRAYKSHVLVVRGSLNHPITYVVDTWKTVEANGGDFKLEPKDIIYVTWRPFIRGEDLLDLAITGFIQSATAAWAGKHIGPIITSPIFK